MAESKEADGVVVVQKRIDVLEARLMLINGEKYNLEAELRRLRDQLYRRMYKLVPLEGPASIVEYTPGLVD